MIITIMNIIIIIIIFSISIVVVIIIIISPLNANWLILEQQQLSLHHSCWSTASHEACPQLIQLRF